jgi:hypothetical protein
MQQGDAQEKLRELRATKPGRVIEHRPVEKPPAEPAEKPATGPLWGDPPPKAANGHAVAAAAPRDNRVFEYDPATGKLRQVG